MERSWGVLGEGGRDLIIAVGTMAPGFFFSGGLPLVGCSALFSNWILYRVETCRCYNPPVILEANIVVLDCKY